MDRASRLLLRSALKMLIDVSNHGQLSDIEAKRVHAAYRRVLLALTDKQ